MNKWWGYIHVNGNIQVKMFFSNLDLEEADESRFVARVYEPFQASSRDEAIKIIKAKEAGWAISYEPPPIPDRNHDWNAVHNDYDGPGDPRCFTGPTPADCADQILEWEKEQQ